MRKVMLLLAAAATSSLAVVAVPGMSQAEPQPPVVGAPPNTGGGATANVGGAAAQANMTYHGGPVQTSPRVYVSWWGWPASLTSTQSTFRNTLTGFINNLGGTSLKAVDTQYSAIANPAGIYGGAWTDTTAIPAHPTQTDVANAASRLAAHFGTSANGVYLVALGPGHGDTQFVANGGPYCAWHAYNGSVAYVSFPYLIDAGSSCNTAGANAYAPASILAYHEITETNTDPQLNAWYAGDTAHENADKCAWGQGGTQPAPEPRWFGPNQYWVQSVWSNRDGQCEFFFLPPGNVTISTSGADALHSGSASCSLSRSYYNTGSDGFASNQMSMNGVPVTSIVECDFTINDPTAVAPNDVLSTNGGAGQTSVSGSGGGFLYGAKGTNQVCVFGQVDYGTDTLNLPERCVNF